MSDIVESKFLISHGKFKQRIVICGSMSFYKEMVEIQIQLAEDGILAIVPEAEGETVAAMSAERFAAFKREVSFKYLKKIRDPETVAVLVVNKDKHGIRDYIGANTFAEIAIAFVQSKKIFLLQRMPDTYIDELEAWKCIELDGYLDRIKQYYKAAIKELGWQPDLFENI
jgi:hypothetical protein